MFNFLSQPFCNFLENRDYRLALSTVLFQTAPNNPSTPPVLSESSHLLQRARLKLNKYSDQYRMSVFSNLNSSFFDSLTSAMEAPMSIGKVDITTNANRQLKKKDMANAAQS